LLFFSHSSDGPAHHKQISQTNNLTCFLSAKTAQQFPIAYQIAPFQQISSLVDGMDLAVEHHCNQFAVFVSQTVFHLHCFDGCNALLMWNQVHLFILIVDEVSSCVCFALLRCPNAKHILSISET